MNNSNNSKIEKISKELFLELAGRKVWIPAHRVENNGITLELLADAVGRQYIPAFYSKTSDIGNFSEKNLVEIGFSQLRHILIDMSETVCGIVVEPFGENLPLDRKALMAYDSAVGGMSVERSHVTGRVGLAVPGRLPDGMKEGLRRFFEKQIGVNRVWALLAKPENEPQPHLCIMIDFFGNKVQLFPLVAEAVKPYMRPGERFELKPVGQGMDMKPLSKGLIYERTASKNM